MLWFFDGKKTFDTIKNNFVADLVVWFEFDPSKVSLASSLSSYKTFTIYFTFLLIGVFGYLFIIYDFFNFFKFLYSML